MIISMRLLGAGESRFPFYPVGESAGVVALPHIPFRLLFLWSFIRFPRFSRSVADPRLGDVPDLTADPTLAEKELGFVADENLETMCRDLWNFQQAHPHGYQ